MRHGMALLSIAFILVLGAGPVMAETTSLNDVRRAFERYSGTRLLFTGTALQSNRFCGQMPALTAEKRLRGAQILLQEVKKYPKGYLGRIGLQKIALLAGCTTSQEDVSEGRVRTRLIGRFNGMWDGKSGAVVVYRRDKQVRRTFHHEAFHQVDATRNGETSGWRHKRSDDPRFREAIALTRPYPKLELPAHVLNRLRGMRTKFLKGYPTRYARTSATEDQAETAAFLMTNLATGLYQAAVHPELAGSQRILHVLREYDGATRAGLNTDWLLGVVLGAPIDVARTKRSTRSNRRVERPRRPRLARGSSTKRQMQAPPPSRIVRRPTHDSRRPPAGVAGRDLLRELKQLARKHTPLTRTEIRRSRDLLRRLSQGGPVGVSFQGPLHRMAAKLTGRMVEDALRPRGQIRLPRSQGAIASYSRWVRQTLREAAEDAERLVRITRLLNGRTFRVAATAISNLRTLATYRSELLQYYGLSARTNRLLHRAATALVRSLPSEYRSQQKAFLSVPVDVLLKALAGGGEKLPRHRRAPS